MRIDVITLFPRALEGALEQSLLKRAHDKGLVQVNLVDLREFGEGRHKVTDDIPFGGGAGMVMKPEPIFRAVDSIRSNDLPARLLLLSPQGTVFDQDRARELSKEPWLVLICGRYEGVDERVRIGLNAEEISIGDYVLMGGETPALVIIEAVARLIPGVVGDPASVETDSFWSGLLSHPQYTRPREFRGMSVPEVLISGNHQEIERWRLKESLRKTRERRPELLKKRRLSEQEQQLLQEIL